MATTETETGHPIQGYNLPGGYYLQIGRRGKGAKLNCRDVELIRRMCRWGMMYEEIMPRFGVSRAVIGSVVTGKTYRDCRE